MVQYLGRPIWITDVEKELCESEWCVHAQELARIWILFPLAIHDNHSTSTTDVLRCVTFWFVFVGHESIAEHEYLWQMTDWEHYKHLNDESCRCASVLWETKAFLMTQICHSILYSLQHLLNTDLVLSNVRFCVFLNRSIHSSCSLWYYGFAAKKVTVDVFVTSERFSRDQVLIYLTRDHRTNQRLTVLVGVNTCLISREHVTHFFRYNRAFVWRLNAST